MYRPELEMYQEDQETEVNQEITARKWPTKLIASCLLVVMLCTVATTPIAVIYRYYDQNRQGQETIIAEAATSQGVNRITYVGTDQQLYTTTQDGTNLNRITGIDGSYQFPVWSPDGSRIAIVSDENLYSFQDQDGAEEAGAYEILYQDDSDRPFYLYWAPDGSEISFLTNHADGLALYLATVGGLSAGRPVAIGQPFYWDWDPSGDELLIHSGLRGEETRLALLDPAQGNISENIIDPGLFQSPGISHDGQYLAYARSGSPGGNHITIQDAAGESTTIDQMHGLVALSWSPVQPLLAYIGSGDEGHAYYGPLQLANAESGDHQTVVNDTIIAFFWSPDGRSIAYLKIADLNDDSVQVEAQTVIKDVLSKPARYQEHFRLELWTINVTSSETRWLATFEPTRVFLTQFLPYFDQYALSHRLWSPASDALIIPMQESNRSRLFVVPMNGDEPYPIADSQIGFWSQK